MDILQRVKVRMLELVRTNDIVMISFIESLLKDLEIEYFIADQNMSVLEGSIGLLPRRIMVKACHHQRAVTLLKDAGISNELFGNGIGDSEG